MHNATWKGFPPMQVLASGGNWSDVSNLSHNILGDSRSVIGSFVTRRWPYSPITSSIRWVNITLLYTASATCTNAR